ncbi:MAG TPA: hypothetical protein VFR33_09790 [Candidatus Dormibacteraeota bacterium]|nr:hypothetical protein [Candidatus Dormibacteraeota bacterium]
MIRIRGRAVRLALATIIAVFAVLGIAYAGLAVSGKGIVIGGLDSCAAIPDPNQPRYAAGTVTVLKGDVAWRAEGSDHSVAVFPTVVVDKREVGANGLYLFVLDQGAYVLQGNYRTATAVPWIELAVTPGTVAHVDVPNMCI